MEDDFSSERSSRSHEVERWFKQKYLGRDLQAPLSMSLDRSPLLTQQAYEVHTRDSASLSPRYQSPTVSSIGALERAESPIGCTVCGTNSIHVAKDVIAESPPRILPHNKPIISHSSLPDSAAFARIIRAEVKDEGGNSIDSVMSDALKIVDWKVIESDEKQYPPISTNTEFCLSQHESAARIQTTVLEEVIPAPPLALTPINYQDAKAVKSSLFYNKTAKKYVQDEERKRVTIRRAEYANRTKGYVRTVQCTSRKSAISEPSPDEFPRKHQLSNQDSLEEMPQHWSWGDAKRQIAKQKMYDIQVAVKAKVAKTQKNGVNGVKQSVHKAPFQQRAGHKSSIVTQLLKSEHAPAPRRSSDPRKCISQKSSKPAPKPPRKDLEPRDDSLELAWKPTVLTEPLDDESTHVYLETECGPTESFHETDFSTPVKRAKSCDIPSSQKSKVRHTRQSPLLSEDFAVMDSRSSSEESLKLLSNKKDESTQTDEYQILNVAVRCSQVYFELVGEERVRKAFEQLEKYKTWAKETPFKELLGV